MHATLGADAHVAAGRACLPGLVGPAPERGLLGHLRKVFTKLGVSSRKELRRMLPDLERAGVLA